MNKIIIIMLTMFVYSTTITAYSSSVTTLKQENLEKTEFGCNWSVMVLEQDNKVVSINLGKTVPAKTSFKIPGIASCDVVNDGQIYTMCTYDKTNSSVIVMPFDDKTLGQMSNMMIFEGNLEDKSKKYIVVTMCSSGIN